MCCYDDERGSGSLLKQVFYDKNPIQDFNDLVYNWFSSELMAPTRSTVPLLELLKSASLLKRIVRDFGMSGNEAFHLEYTVPPRRGRGKASHTDLMIYSGCNALAIECKWTEPAYETVEQWLGGDGTPNRRLVIAGWLEILQPYARRRLHYGDCSNITYQLIHRAASACAIAERPRLAYLLFDSPSIPTGTPVHHYREHMDRLHRFMGLPTRFPFYLARVVMRVRIEFIELMEAQNASFNGAALQNALSTGRLFDFKGFDMERLW
jgi:hypothetical protein